MLQTLTTQAAPELREAAEDCPLAVWQARYPDRWLFVAVTSEDDGAPLTGRLLAVAALDIALAPLWHAQTQQGKIIALLSGRSTEAGPIVVA